jgi:hypothetical protein
MIQMKRLAVAFLQIVLSDELLECLELEELTAESKHLTDDVFKNLFADVIYRVPIKNTKHHVDLFVILEHKSGNDFWTILQLWGYVCYVVRREFKKAEDAGQANVDYQLPPVIAIIVHHGKSKFTGKTELSELFLQLPGIEKYLPKLQAILFDLSAISDDDVPDNPEVPELKLALTALKAVFRKDVSTKITIILEELKPPRSSNTADDPAIRDLIRRVWCYLVASAQHMEQDYTVLFDTIKTIVEVEPMPTMLEKWTAERKDEWKAEGIAEGEARGEARGEAKRGRDVLLAILRRKFDRIPRETEQTILAMTDTVALESWAVQASMCQSLDEFLEALN